MAPTAQPPASAPPQRPSTNYNDEIPTSSDLYNIATRAFKTGALTGAGGLVFGAGAGILRSAPPALFSLFAGLQWFALGFSYSGTRSLLWHTWGGEENLSPRDKVMAGTLAGAASGMTGGLIRGPTNIIPGIFVLSTVGGTTSYISHRLNEKEKENETKAESKQSLWSKWSPLQVLSDQDYEKMLEEKILRVDADIAIIDDHIAALKASKQQTKLKEGAETPKK